MLDSTNILEVELAGFIDKLYVEGGKKKKKKWVKDDSTIVARESGNRELLMKKSLYGTDLERNLVFKFF